VEKRADVREIGANIRGKIISHLPAAFGRMFQSLADKQTSAAADKTKPRSQEWGFFLSCFQHAW